MPRPRFKEARIASSDHYEWSLRYHRKYLRREHEKNSLIIQTLEVHVRKMPYVGVFGKLVPLTLNQAKKLSETIEIIWQQNYIKNKPV